MAASTSPPTAPAPADQDQYRLTVNSYDRTASLIIALLVIVGLAVTGMAVVFFTGKFVRTVEPIPVVPVEASSPNANQGIAQEPDPPGVEDAPNSPSRSSKRRWRPSPTRSPTRCYSPMK